jgi:hypothetical protein
MKRALARGAIFLTTLLLGEALLRLLVGPSSTASCQLQGHDLPPYQVVQGYYEADVDRDRRLWEPTDRANPERLTKGDLQGRLREDENTGYTNEENATSVRGWSSSNNLGANSAEPLSPQPPAGRKRVLIFGESYGRGSRIPQAQSWSQVLQRACPQLEVVNLCVDGFGMGQAYRRYLNFPAEYHYARVIFVCVPEVDAWRDMNTMRFLGENWYAFTILPRYRVQDGQLEWVPGPYPKGSDIYHHDVPNLTPPVREHLRKYDAFYVPLLYEEGPPWLGKSILYKLVARYLGERRKQQTYQNSIWGTDSEGMAVEREIFKAVRQREGRNFRLVLMPSPELLREVRDHSDPRRLRVWEAKLAAFRSDGEEVVDLLPGMRGLSADEIDEGVDGTHYGPKTNAAIAKLLEPMVGAP